MLSKRLCILFQTWQQLIKNTMIDDIENKIENLRLQKCSLKLSPLGIQLFR